MNEWIKGRWHSYGFGYCNCGGVENIKIYRMENCRCTTNYAHTKRHSHICSIRRVNSFLNLCWVHRVKSSRCFVKIYRFRVLRFFLSSCYYARIISFNIYWLSDDARVHQTWHTLARSLIPLSILTTNSSV